MIGRGLFGRREVEGPPPEPLYPVGDETPIYEPPAEPVEGERYRAFGRENTVATMLEVRQRPTTRLRERGQILPFAYLLQTAYSGAAGSDLVSMMFTTCVVTIAGEHLGELRQALRRGELDFVQEFDGERWERPGAGQAVVRSIRVSKPGEEGEEGATA